MQQPAAQPMIPGIPVRGPRYAPPAGSVLIGYRMVQPEPGCCQFDGFTTEGWLAVIVLIFIFWPLAWIPCVMDQCYTAYQEPVFGYPTGQPPQQPHNPQAPTQPQSPAPGVPVAPAQYPQQPPQQPGQYPNVYKPDGSAPASYPPVGKGDQPSPV